MSRGDGTAGTVAAAWRLRRRDGRVLGFTDHDEDLQFDGTLFVASSGWTAGEAEGALGLAAGTARVEGALRDASIAEADIAAGLFDGAEIEVFRVDWTRPGDAVLVDRLDLGEVTRGAGAFTAELRGLAARLDRTHGRTYRRRCDAAFGDRRCGVDLRSRGLVRHGTVAGADGEAILVAGLGSFERALFARGRIAVGGGEPLDLAGLSPGADGGTWRVALAEAQGVPPRPGTIVQLLAGCDRSFRTCRDRYANAVNFRGFPHLPGADAALGVAKSDMRHDGAPVVP